VSARRVVLRGSIRVDARRARAKLREHLLLDLHGYSLELARAAIALGAGAMDVSWDADEVRFAFDGPALPGERLARLLDFALSDAADEHAAPLRCLALGVNAALGLGAESVTVTSTSAGGAVAASFTPELFADEGEAPLELRAEACTAPEGAFAQGTHVRVKKRLGVDVLKRAVSGAAPPEVRLLLENTRESPLRVSCKGVPVARAATHPLLARAPLTLPGAYRAAVELQTIGAPCRMDVMERGVRLLTASWVPLPGLEPTEGLAPPVRLVVDADELPTNASRSALREDAPLTRELLPAAEVAFRRLLGALVAHAKGEPLPEGVEVVGTLDAEPLGCLVVLAVAALRAGTPLDPEVRALVELPLLDSAGGGKLSVGRALSHLPVRVWRGEDPLPDQLAPWLTDVVWPRGRIVERVLDGVAREDAAALVERARQGAARRARFLAHAPSEPVVPRSSAELARQRFAHTTGPTAGLSGEVALLAPLAGGGSRPSLLRVFIEDRMLEALPLEPSACPLAFDAAIAWPEALRPRFDYDGVERDARLAQATYAVGLSAIGMADRAAEQLKRVSGPERAAFEQVLRHALAAYRDLPLWLGLARPPAQAFRRDFARLYQAELFTTADGGRASLSDLDAYAKKTGALCVLPPGTGREHDSPDARPLVVASGAEAEAILPLLAGKVERIPYDRLATSPSSPESRRAALVHAVSNERVRQGLSPLSAQLWLEREGAMVLVAPGLFGSSIESHLGTVLSTTVRNDLSTLIIAIDDPATVPSPDWNATHWKPKRHTGWIEQRFAERLVEALEGNAEARQALGILSSLVYDDVALPLCLLARLVQLRARVASREGKPERRQDVQQRELAARIETLPLLCCLDERGLPAATSIASVVGTHGDAPPLLDRPPGFATGDWRPLLVRNEREREISARLFRGGIRGDAELGARRAEAAVLHVKQQLLRAPELDLGDLGNRIAPGDFVLRVPAAVPEHPYGELAVAVALPHPDLAPGLAWVSLRFMGRPVHHGLGPSEVGLPVVANVSSTRADDFEAFARPSPEGLGRIGGRLREASLSLVHELARQGTLLSDSRALALCLTLYDLGNGGAVLDLFSQASLHFPTVQGGAAPLSLLSGGDRTLHYGRERYSTWLALDARASDLDRPILFLPPGDLGSLLDALLGRFGYQVTDVSAALAALQRQRGGGAAAAPKLDGAPVHPALRAALWEAGVAVGDGEVEVTRGPRSSVSVLLLDGRSESFEVDLLTPVRAVVRVDSINLAAVHARLLSELEIAGRRILVRAAEKLHEVPSFVKALVRRQLCLNTHARDENALAGAVVFEDTAGFGHSLGGLVADSRWSYTTLELPYPPMLRPTLRLTEEEAIGLRGGVELVKVDQEVARFQRSERRRNATPVASLMLPPELRAACFVTAAVRVEGTAGEVGVLTPAHAELRGGTLHVGHRPLCDLDDRPGWPIVAILNDDSVAPDDFFESPADRSVLAELVRRARGVARMTLQASFSPGSALAARFFEDEAVGGFRVTGCLWLGSSFPAAPKVRVYAGGRAAPLVRCLEALGPPAHVAPALPVEGDLLVRRDGDSDAEGGVGAAIAMTLANLDTLSETWQALNELGARIAVELLHEARARGVEAPALDEHALSLALLGLDVPTPALHAADGAPLVVAEVLAELALAGKLWTSDGRASVDGAFPGAMPSFFLPERSPLVNVLAKRLPTEGLRALGSLKAERVLAPPDFHAAASAPPELPPPSPDGGEPSFWDRFLAVLSGTDEEQVEDTRAPEHLALLSQVLELRLTGGPVEGVAVGRGKRPLRYDSARKRLLIGRGISATLLATGGGAAVLAAHAVCEVNRALVEVTDGEEHRALIALLKEL